MTDRFEVAFEGPGIESGGVPLADFQATLEHVQRAVRLMVAEIVGGGSGRGRPSDLVRRESALRLLSTSRGSLHAHVGLESRGGAAMMDGGYGALALDRIFAAGEAIEALPEPVLSELHLIGTDTSSAVGVVRLSSPAGERSWEFHCIAPTRRKRAVHNEEQALLSGWLREVDWANRSARLHRSDGPYVRLAFDAALDNEMRQLANTYVEVRGSGSFDAMDRWRTVQVEQLTSAHSSNEPFDVERFLNAPNPKVFDARKMVTASEPFDVDEFLSVIRQARHVVGEEAAD